MYKLCWSHLWLQPLEFLGLSRGTFPIRVSSPWTSQEKPVGKRLALFLQPFYFLCDVLRFAQMEWLWGTEKWGGEGALDESCCLIGFELGTQHSECSFIWQPALFWLRPSKHRQGLQCVCKTFDTSQYRRIPLFTAYPTTTISQA